MMRRHVPAILAALALLLSFAPLRAVNPARRDGGFRVLYGVEWGYDMQLLNAYHHNYTDESDGFRVDEKKVKPTLYSNGHAAAHVTTEFAEKFALGFHVGYAGIQQRTRFFPMSLRFAYFMDSYTADGNFVFLEGGAGIHEQRSTVSPFVRTGYGHRIRLTRRASMDFSASLRCTGDHPPIYDASIPGYVDEKNVRRSDALYGALIFSISLNF